MARYGTFKYGDGTKYGTSPTTDLMLWSVRVDWDRDGVFDGINEGTRVMDLKIRRGRENYFEPGGRGFVKQKIGTAELILTNDDGRYDPYNTASPLYPNVTPGCKIEIRVKDGNEGSIEDVFEGRISDIIPVAGIERKIKIKAVDGWDFLKDETANVGLNEDYNAGSAIEDVLSAVGWDGGETIDSGSDVLPYFWADNRPASDIIFELAEAGLGRVYVNAGGDLVYKNRHHAETPILTINEDYILRDIFLPSPWDNIRNKCKINVYPRVLQDSAVLWELQGDNVVPAGESVIYWANFTFEGRNVPIKNMVTPVASTDYSLNSQSDGGGTDLTADCIVEVTAYGTVGMITITNNASVNGYLTLQVRGQAVDTPDVVTVISDQSGTESPRVFELDLQWQQNPNNAVQFAIYLATYFGVNRLIPEFEIENRFDKQFGVDLQELITLEIPNKDFDDDVLIGYIEHNWLNETGQAVRTYIKTEPYIDLSGLWYFPISDFGTDTVFSL